jgi:hypothetical protein
MIKNLILILAFLFGFIVAQAQNNWVNYKVDNKISVKFPSQPAQLSDGTVFFSNKDSTVKLGMFIFDFSKVAKIDSADLPMLRESLDFIMSAANLMSIKNHCKEPEDLKKAKWNGFTSYTAKGAGMGSGSGYCHILMFLIGNKLYTFGATLSATADSKIKDDYFSSITLN